MAGKSVFDPSLFELFTAELEVHLPTLSEGLLALEKDPTLTGQLNALMRAAHSIKGAARIVGLEKCVELTHVLEDCFVAAQEGQIELSGDGVDVLLRAVDLLPQVAQPEVPPEVLPQVATLVAELQAVKQGRLTASPRPGPDPSSPAPLAPPSPPPPPPPTPEAPDPFEKAVATPGTDAAAETTLQVPGNLDAASAEQLRSRLVALLNRKVPAIQLDFAEVDQVDPTGLALLAGAARRARSGPQPTTLEIHNAATGVRDLLQQTRLDQLLTVMEPS